MPTNLIGKLYFRGYIMFLFVSYYIHSISITRTKDNFMIYIVIIFIIIVYVSSTL